MSTHPYVDSTRGMRGRVHVRVFEGDSLVIDTERSANPFPTAAKARAYAMRWKYGGRKHGITYRVVFADAGSES